MGHADQGDGHPTLNVALRPQEGLLLFCWKADGYEFKRSLNLHVKETNHQI